MHTLFIDLCSHRKIVACADEEKTLSCADIPDHTNEADLLPAIERMLSKAKVTLKEIDRIAAVTGPGGFMSQRVELALANTLAWSLKIPIAGVHLSDLWHARIQSSSLKAQSFVWLHSTQKKALFIRGFGELEKKWPEPMLLPIEEALKEISERTPFIGELIPEHAAVLPVHEVPNLQPLEGILPSLLQTLPYDKPPVLPWYGRGI